jgi:hypothetical protein
MSNAAFVHSHVWVWITTDSVGKRIDHSRTQSIVADKTGMERTTLSNDLTQVRLIKRILVTHIDDFSNARMLVQNVCIPATRQGSAPVPHSDQKTKCGFHSTISFSF